MKVNLHTHSNISDGALTPKELVEKLHSDGLDVFALTDHDRLDGLSVVRQEAEKLGMSFINGIEISCRLTDIELPFINETSSVHLLGLNFNLDALKLNYQKRQMDKQKRLIVLLDKLLERGYEIQINKPLVKKTQIAEALVNTGYTKDIQTAFNEIINRYYDRNIDNMTVKEAIQMVHDAQGKILWAHPFDILDGIVKRRINEEQVDKFCQIFKELGIDGIEVYYQRFTDEQRSYLKSLQNKYQFIASAGTDYHAKPMHSPTYVEIEASLIKEVLS